MRNRSLAILAICLCLSLSLITIGGGIRFAEGASTSLVTVSFIYVGEGDSLLIHAQNVWVLVDGGPSDAGSTVVNYLQSSGVTELSLMVATHMDADHIGGLVTVLKSSITIDRVLINNMTDTTSTYNQFITLAQKHIVLVAQRGSFYSLTSAVNLTVYNPVQPLQFTDQNDNSVVMKLQAGKTSFLLEGDAGTDAEQSMINAGLNLHCDVLKVGHHGSQYATCDAFLDRAQPTYAVISCGIDNDYGFPTTDVLQRLTNHDVLTFGTYESGTIVATSDGSTVTFQSNYTPIATPLSTPNPTPSPTVSPSPTANPTAKETVSPSSTPTLTPRVPELPALALLPLFLGVLTVAAKMRLQRSKQSRNVDSTRSKNFNE